MCIHRCVSVIVLLSTLLGRWSMQGTFQLVGGVEKHLFLFFLLALRNTVLGGPQPPPPSMALVKLSPA